MQVDLTVRTENGSCDVRVTTGERHGRDEVLAALAEHVYVRAAAAHSPDRGRPVYGHAHSLQIRDGAVVELGAPSSPAPNVGSIRVHVVAGPDAGSVTRLPLGSTIVGRSDRCGVVIRDPSVSRRHAQLTVTATGVSVRDLGSTNGVQLDEAQVGAAGRAAQLRQYVRLGDSVICVVDSDEPAAAIHVQENGRLLVHRAPRMGDGPDPDDIQLPPMSSLSAPAPVQWMAALLPAIAGGTLAVVTRNPSFLAFMLISPVLLLATSLGDRLHWRRSRRKLAADLRRQRADLTTRCMVSLREETDRRRRAGPDAATVFRAATVPTCRLWERRRRDDDWLVVRLGTHTVDSTVQVRGPETSRPAGRVRDVPAGVDLRRGPLGVAGPAAASLAVARSALGQLCTLHSPADLELVPVLGDDSEAAWTWVRWLPHLRCPPGHGREQRQAAVTGVARLVGDRLAARAMTSSPWNGPWTVLVVDAVVAGTETEALERVLATGASVGVTALCVAEQLRHLPAGCVTVAQVGGDAGSRLSVRTADREPINVIGDGVRAEWADELARALAPLADGNADTPSSPPTACRLRDLVHDDITDPEVISVRWRDAHGPRTVVGATSEGSLELDLVRDGPHVLIAGTTGAGKSELLQAVVLGLASAMPPDRLSFVLIDYKGGAAFADCARLPHTVGFVTDLDPHLTRRALSSLEAELRRREQIFTEARVTDLDALWHANLTNRAPVARLILVVDEFAALAEDLPNFLDGLVGIAQRGRSLGLHLVLATQRPGGVVSPEIRANCSLRIALRVTEPAESVDVIGRPDAAGIDERHPGRAFVRTGTTVTEMHTARVSSPPPQQVESVVIEDLDAWRRPHPSPAPATPDHTDMHLIVDAVGTAALRNLLRPAPSPWLPALPERMPMPTSSSSAGQPIAVGIVDLPHEQRQQPLTVDLRQGGSVLLVGGSGSGRTTALRTIAARATAELSADQLHVYVLDCSGGSLRPMAPVPHCGAVLTRGEFFAASRLLEWLADEVSRRRAVLSSSGTNAHPAGVAGSTAAAVLVLVDGWEGLAAAADDFDAGRTADRVIALLRDAAAVGVTVVLTGDRGALSSRIMGAARTTFVFRLADRADFALAGIPTRDVPHVLPPGRALRVVDRAEVQFGYVGDEPDATHQTEALLRAARTDRSARSPRPPFLIRALPACVTLDELPITAEPHITIGVGGDAAAPVCVDLFLDDARWLVVGGPRTGRTTALCVVLAEAVRHGISVAVVAPRRCALRSTAQTLGVATFGAQDDLDALAGPNGRRRLVLVDDSETLLDTAAGDALVALSRSADPHLAMVVAGRADDVAVTYRGIVGEIRRSRAGVLLAPGPGDGDVFGVRLASRRESTPGRGLLVTDQPAVTALGGGSGVLPIQVAQP